MITADRLRDYLVANLPRPAMNRPERFTRDFNERLKENFPAIRELLRTPRQIKRLGMALSRRPVLAARLNPFDVFVWELLRQTRPSLYEFIAQRPWFLRPDQGEEADWVVKAVMDKDRRTKEIEAIDEFIKTKCETPEAVAELLWTLFPKVASDSSDAKNVRLRRINNWSFFNCYFLLEPDEGLDRPEQIDSMVQAVNGLTTSTDAKALVSKSLSTAVAHEWLTSWISLMHSFSEDIKPDKVRYFVEAIHEFIGANAESPEPDIGKAFHPLVSLSVELAEILPDYADAMALIGEMASSTKNIALAGLYLFYARESAGTRAGSVSFQHLRAAFDRRLEHQIISLGEKVFDRLPSELATVIARYSDKEKLSAFLLSAAGDVPKYWAQVVFPLVSLWSDGNWRVDDERVRHVSDEVLAKATKVLSGASIEGWPDHLVNATKAFLAWRQNIL